MYRTTISHGMLVDQIANIMDRRGYLEPGRPMTMIDAGYGSKLNSP